MDKKFWAEAINTATYIKNRTGPTVVNNKCPYDLWHNKSFSLKGLKIFGSKVSCHVPKEKRLNDENLGLVKYFLDMVITQDITAGEIKINQTNYLKSISLKYNMQNCKPVSSPMNCNFKHDVLLRSASESCELENKCRALIGSLMYSMLCSRPDLSISISILSRYQKCASNELWQALKRVLRYIQGTLNYSLIFKCRESFNEANCIVGFCDSDWAGDG